MTLFRSWASLCRGGGRKFIKPQQEKARREERRNKMMVTDQSKFVFGFRDLIPMESEADKSAENNTSTFTNENEEPAEK